MPVDNSGDAEVILLVGVGDLTTRVAHLLSCSGRDVKLVIGSRSIERATRYANLCRLAAYNLDRHVQVAPIEIDLEDVSRTSEQLAVTRPAVIFMGASIQAARTIMRLPEDLFRQLDAAQLGPWLPMHLALNYELMQACRLSGIDTVTVNGCYPDAVGPALATQGLAPSIGVGNVANIVPAISLSASRVLECPVDLLRVRVIAHHYFSHHVHRFGEADGIPFKIDVQAPSGAVELDWAILFRELATDLRRQGGKDGQQVTATSAVRAIIALLSETPSLVHAPAPLGRPGGYPLQVSRTGAVLDLPTDITVNDAERINLQAQHMDGIAGFDRDGTIRFVDENMQVMDRVLGYHCLQMNISESRQAATELTAKYDLFLRRRGLLS